MFEYGSNKDLDFEKDLEIDLSNLHVNWQKHADKRFNYSERLANCEMQLRKAKQKLKVVQAQVMLDAKKAEPKTTQAILEALCLTNKECIELNKEIIDLEHEKNIISGAVQAFDDRKHALQKLVGLYVADYFSCSSVKEEEDSVDLQRRVLNQKK